MYLELFHGRKTKEEDMDDWGFQGPSIGPLQYAHTTYGNEIKMAFVNDEDRVRFGFKEPECWLTIEEGMVVYQDSYYGDWSTWFCAGQDVQKPDPQATQKPAWSIPERRSVLAHLWAHFTLLASGQPTTLSNSEVAGLIADLYTGITGATLEFDLAAQKIPPLPKVPARLAGYRDDVVDAMAMWEAVAEALQVDNPNHQELFERVDGYRKAHGTATLRDAVARMQPLCSADWDASGLQGDQSFDWNFVPDWLLNNAPWDAALEVIEGPSRVRSTEKETMVEASEAVVEATAEVIHEQPAESPTGMYAWTDLTNAQVDSDRTSAFIGDRTFGPEQLTNALVLTGDKVLVASEGSDPAGGPSADLCAITMEQWSEALYLVGAEHPRAQRKLVLYGNVYPGAEGPAQSGRGFQPNEGELTVSLNNTASEASANTLGTLKLTILGKKIVEVELVEAAILGA